MNKPATQTIDFSFNYEGFEKALKEATTPDGKMFTRAIIWRNREECDEFLPLICEKGHPYRYIALAYTSGKLEPYMVHELNVTFTPDCVFIHIPSAIPIVKDAYDYCKHHEMEGPITFIYFAEEEDIS